MMGLVEIDIGVKGHSEYRRTEQNVYLSFGKDVLSRVSIYAKYGKNPENASECM